MRAIFWAFIIIFTCGNFSANASSLPKTSITLNTGKGCAVHIASWLSPSCTHCAEYFLKELPEIIKLPGFCLDLHFLPHLYLLDMSIAVLIWSQGPHNAYSIAKFFYENQNEWLNLSSSRDKLDDPRRIEDLNAYLAEVMARNPRDYQKIKNYLEANDQLLYVKIIALKHFSVEHLERYLPKGKSIDTNLSFALLSNLPVKDGKAINFSPAFTSESGQLLPDNMLQRGILTIDIAKDMLSKAGPIIPPTTPTPRAKKTAKTISKSKNAFKKQIPIPKIEPKDREIQDVDDDIEMQDNGDIQYADDATEMSDINEQNNNLETEDHEDNEEDSEPLYDENDEDMSEETKEDINEELDLSQKNKAKVKKSTTPISKKKKQSETQKPTQNSKKKQNKRNKPEIHSIIDSAVAG